MIGVGALLVALAAAPSDDIEGCWSGEMELGAQELPIDGWIEFEDRLLFATLHLPALGQMNLRLLEVPPETNPEGAFALQCPLEGGTLRFEGELEEARWSGIWSWRDLGGTFELRRDRDLPPPYRELPVRIGAGRADDGPELAGTVLLPAGEGPHPAIVWVHGSGAIGRKSSTYVREAYVLARQGYASVTYDKRGVGESAGEWRTATFQELAADASEARRALVEVEGVDATRVGIGGISQGPSWIAPLACSQDPGFHFVVALSASSVTAATQHLYVVERRLALAGHDEQVIARALELHERIDLWQREGGERGELERDLSRAANEPWFEAALLPRELEPYDETLRAWMWLDAAPLWRELRLPVFAAWGASDDIVNPARSSRMLRELLGERVEAHVFPGADHLLRLAYRPQPAPIAPGFHAALLAWLDETLGD